MRLKREAVEQMMSERPPDTRLEDVLEAAGDDGYECRTGHSERPSPLGRVHDEV